MTDYSQYHSYACIHSISGASIECWSQDWQQSTLEEPPQSRASLRTSQILGPAFHTHPFSRSRLYSHRRSARQRDAPGLAEFSPFLPGEGKPLLRAFEFQHRSGGNYLLAVPLDLLVGWALKEKGSFITTGSFSEEEDLRGKQRKVP